MENIDRKKLDLGWCQGYMALKYHLEEALLEMCDNPKYTSQIKDINNPKNMNHRPEIAIFSRKYYSEFDKLNYNKIHDYCFIGSIDTHPENRKWVIDFAKNHFTSNSIFINTDNDPNWISLGDFDLSHKNLGFNPKKQKDTQCKKTQYRIVNENIFYFQSMAQSKYVLCPAGDAPWAFKFYEILMCKSIPIVETWHHTYRTATEAKFNYQYILYYDISRIQNLLSNQNEYQSIVDTNTEIFNSKHLLH